jgi:hypothetical protein
MRFDLLYVMGGRAARLIDARRRWDEAVRNSGRAVRQITADCSNQYVKIEWLLEKLRRELCCSVCRSKRKCCDNENGHAWPLNILVKQKIPPTDWHHTEIGDHQIGLVFTQAFQRLFTASRSDDIPSLDREDAA